MNSNANRDLDTRIVDPDAERERGILTPHDRAFLRTEPGEGVREDMSDTAVRQKRHKIRNRFRNALIDIQYLLLLEQEDLTKLFPSDEVDGYELDIIHGAVLGAVYHMIRAESDREAALKHFGSMVENDIIREYAENHGVYAAGIELTLQLPPVDECPPLEDILSQLQDGEEIPYKAHMALDYGGIHPNPEKHL